MVPADRALFGPWADRQFLLRIFAHVISITLSLMAWLTKVCVSPAKPLRSWATVLALELNKIFPMFGAVLYRNFAAVRANQFLRLEGTCVLRFIHRLSAIFPASKIGLFAFKTLKVSINCHSILIRLLKIRRFGIFKLLIFITLFKF